MSKRAPSTTQLLVIAGFALSCFGILLFLWITFGGPTPFKAKPYEINVPFKEATQLAQQSDVRISGVSVGKVQDIVLAPNGEQAMAKVDIDDKYGPIPANTRADPAHQDAARRDLHRTHPGRPQRPQAAPTAAPCPRRRSPNRSSSTRSSAPSTPKPAPPSRPGSRKRRSRSRARAPTSPTPSASSNRPSPASTASSACSTASGSRSSSSSATAPPRCSALRGRQGELAGLIRKLQRRLQHHGGPRPRHRSALPRLPHLPGRVEADPQPAQELRAQRRPGDEAAGPGRRTALADPDRLLQAGAAGEGLLRRPRTGDRPRPDRLPRRPQALPRRVPAAAARRRSLPAQPQPGDHRPRPLQARADRDDGKSSPRCSNAKLPTNAAGDQVHYLRAMGPFNPESLATYPEPHHDRSDQRLPAATGRRRASPPACRASTPAAAPRASRPRSIPKPTKTPPSRNAPGSSQKERAEENEKRSPKPSSKT